MHKVLDFIKKNKQFSFFLLLVILLALITIFAPVIAPQDPYVSDLKNALQPPSSDHWFGTDKLGRDIFSRVIYASRSSLPATLILVVLIFAIGTLLGTLAGYFGGWIDAVIMRISDMMISFPGMVLAIAVAGIMGASVKNAVIAVAVVSWPKSVSYTHLMQMAEMYFQTLLQKKQAIVRQHESRGSVSGLEMGHCKETLESDIRFL